MGASPRLCSGLRSIGARREAAERKDCMELRLGSVWAGVHWVEKEEYWATVPVGGGIR